MSSVQADALTSDWTGAQPDGLLLLDDALSGTQQLLIDLPVTQLVAAGLLTTQLSSVIQLTAPWDGDSILLGTWL